MISSFFVCQTLIAPFCYFPGRERDYFSPGFLMLYCASSLLIPAIGTIVYFARRANMKGSYSLVDAQKSKV